MTYTQPPTKAAGENLTAADWNTYVGANGSALYSPPACRVLNTAGTAPTASEVTIPFASEDFDTHSMHDNTTNNSRITITSGWSGVYLLSATITTSTAAGAQLWGIYEGGTALVAGGHFTGNSPLPMSVSAPYRATVGQYFEIRYNLFGSAPNASFTSAQFSAVWLRGPV